MSAREDVIRWRVCLASPPEIVHRFLSTRGGRERFWAVSAAEVEETATTTVAEPVAGVTTEPSASAANADQIRASFEAALEVLRSGADQRSAFDVVSALYKEVSGIIGEA